MTIKRFLLLIILFLLIFPAVQHKTNIIKIKGLTGVFVPHERPSFSKKLWLTGDFQKQYTQWREDSIGFRPDLVRLYNQVNYSLFRVPGNSQNLVAGRDGYIFGYEYIESYLGLNFRGEKKSYEKVKRLIELRNKLRDEFGIRLLIIFAPDKTSFYPEKIPGHYLAMKGPQNNYGFFSKSCAEAGLDVIDFNRWFLEIKDTCRYPLYPITGAHWSLYGATLTADSLSDYIREKYQANIPDLKIDSIEISNCCRGEDEDLGNLMNLIWKIPHPAYAYPKVHYDWDSTSSKPKALFVGDSYFWTWYWQGYVENLFSNKEFWYYDKTVYPESFTKQLSTNQLNTREILDRQDIVILLQTNGGYGDPGYGFVERMFAELNPLQEDVLKYERKIRNSEEWMSVIRKKAKERNITVDEMINIDARYMAAQDKSKEQKKS